MEAKAGKVRVAEINKRRMKERSRKKIGGKIEKKKEKPKKESRMEVRKVVEEWEIWDEEEEVVKLEEEARKLVP